MDEDDFEATLRGRGGWRALGVPAMLALSALVLPLVAHFEINGRDYVKLGGGLAAIVLGLVTIAWALLRSVGPGSKALSGIVGLLAIVGGTGYVFLSGFGFASFASHDDEDARLALIEDGFEDVEIVSRSDDGHRFEFDAHRDGERCEGSIRFSGFGTGNRSRNVTCGLPERLEVLEAACARRASADPCAEAARRLRREEPVDWPRATRLSDAACDLGADRECFYVGVARELGDRGLGRDIAQALAGYQRACDGGDTVGCRNSAIMLRAGRGAPRDATRACALFHQACEADDMGGCVGLATCHRDGEGREQDLGAARRLLTRACDADYALGCVNLAALHLDGRGAEADPARAHALYQRGCTLGDAIGCRMVAELMLEGTGTEADPTDATARLDRFCEGGDGYACNFLGTAFAEAMHGLTQDRPRAFALFTRGCDAGEAASCSNLGVYHRAGFGGASHDAALAQTYFRRACDAGYQHACGQLTD